MQRLELRLPPPVVLLLWAAAMKAGAWVWPALAFDLPARRPLAAALALAGLVCALAGAWAFRNAQTTLDPRRPERASCVVSTGIYRCTRNPMYLGIALLLAAWATYLAHALAFVAWPLFIAYLTRFQIVPEERHLREKFGPEYAAYQARVRRWL